VTGYCIGCSAGGEGGVGGRPGQLLGGGEDGGVSTRTIMISYGSIVKEYHGAIMNARWLRFFLCVLVALPSWAQAQGQPDNMQCVLEMELPRYSFIARNAVHNTGTVDIAFRIRGSAEIEDIQASAPDDRLVKEVLSVLETAAEFSPSCVGRRVHMIFTFELKGEARDNTFTLIKFKPPNHFVILSQPRLPTIDKLPSNKPR